MSVKKWEDEGLMTHDEILMESSLLSQSAAFTEKELIQSLSVLKMKFL